MGGIKVAGKGQVGDTSQFLTVAEFRQWLAHRYERETLTHIAESLGVSHASVLHWLKGTRVPGRTVRLLAGALRRGDPGTWPLGPSGAQDDRP